MTWLRDTPQQGYDYLVDVTAVEYRDRERPLEVVYFLRSLARRADLRVKVELDPRGDLSVDSVVPLWHEIGRASCRERLEHLADAERAGADDQGGARMRA